MTTLFGMGIEGNPKMANPDGVMARGRSRGGRDPRSVAVAEASTVASS